MLDARGKTSAEKEGIRRKWHLEYGRNMGVSEIENVLLYCA